MGHTSLLMSTLRTQRQKLSSSEEHMKSTQANFARESRFAKSLYGDLPKSSCVPSGS